MSEAFVEVVDRTALQRRVAQLGAEITEAYAGRPPVMIGVLNGCLPFLADLCRAVDLEAEVDMLSLTRFGTEGRVGIALDVSIPLRDRDVLIVEDIVDTGLTLTSLRRELEVRGVRSLATVALLDKAPRRIVEVPIEFRGFEVGDEFLLGYGLDWNGLFRNLPSLWVVMDPADLTDTLDEFASAVYGTALLGS